VLPGCKITLIMSDVDTVRPKGAKVFLSYASADKGTARYIADELRRSGVDLWFDEWELKLGDSIVQHIDRGVASSDIILILLSPASVESNWIQHEWSAAFARQVNDRAIRILPVLIADCEIPPLLATRAYLDLRGNMESGVRRLVAQLSAAPAIEYSHFTPQGFERLIADLLKQLGFVVTDLSGQRDLGFDLRAEYKTRDPFGAEENQTWLVQVKLYKNSRVSVQTIHQTLGVLTAEREVTMGLIVTNGNMTSEARRVLQSYSVGNRLRIIEGTELTSLIVQYPSLVERHFPRSGDRG
jgi:hypothetical protein